MLDRLPILLALSPFTIATCAPPAQQHYAPEAPAAVVVSAAVPEHAPSALVDDTPMPEPADESPTVRETETGLRIADLVVGGSDEVQPGSRLVVHYDATLEDGTAIDSSRKRNTPFEFTLGQGMLIPGFEQGVVGMRVGGVRRVTIPSHLGYGPKGHPPTIPPGATLIFEIEVLAVK